MRTLRTIPTAMLIAWLLAPALLPSDLSAADGPFAGAVPVDADYATGFNSIAESDSKAILTHLVEGDMSGRGTGQEGFQLAARWFASQLEAAGFQPGGPDGSWFQSIPFVRYSVTSDQCSFRTADAELISGKALGISNYSGSFEGSLPVTFATLAGKRPESAEGSLAGRLLIVQAAGRISAEDPYLLSAKPACILIVTEDSRVRNEAVNQTEQTPGSIPLAMVTRTAANALAAACGLQTEYFAAGNPKTNVQLASSQEIACQLTIERESMDVPNVIGWLPGTDESLRHEHILLGAHLDHLGVQRGDLYPGADDNGSGSTAILQIAKALHANPIKPKRSVILMAFCAEERGLLGSKHYVANPVKPLADMICMLNVDMVGRNEETETEPASDNENTIHLVASKDHSAQLHELVLKANHHVGFVFEYDEEERVDGRSDHASFSRSGIPVTFLFGGFHPRYHKPTDTMEGINFAKISNAARLNYLVIMMAAEHGRFVLDEKK